MARYSGTCPPHAVSRYPQIRMKAFLKENLNPIWPVLRAFWWFGLSAVQKISKFCSLILLWCQIKVLALHKGPFILCYMDSHLLEHFAPVLWRLAELDWGVVVATKDPQCLKNDPLFHIGFLALHKDDLPVLGPKVDLFVSLHTESVLDDPIRDFLKKRCRNVPRVAALHGLSDKGKTFGGLEVE